MITTKSKKLYEKAKKLKNLAYGKKNKFQHELIGFNYRMPNISAAIGLGQLESINTIFKQKKNLQQVQIKSKKYRWFEFS